MEAAVALLPTLEQASVLGYRTLVLRAELLAEKFSLDDLRCRQALQMAVDAARALGSAWVLLDSENDLAMAETAAGNHDTAAEMLKKVANEAAQQHFGSIHRMALMNISTVNLRAGKFQAAAGMATKTANAASLAGDWRCEGMAYSVRADALRQLGRLQEAEAAITRSIELKHKSGDANLAIALLRRSDICLEGGALEDAQSAAISALEQAQAAGNDDHIARARLWLGLHAPLGSSDPAEQLRDLVAELLPKAAILRAPTVKLLQAAQARTELGQPSE